MKLLALTEPTDIAPVYARMAERLLEGSEPRQTTIKSTAGTQAATVFWRPDLGIWFVLDPERIENRYWCAYGIGEPHATKTQPIVCEISVPKEGLDRKVAGIFARDAHDGNKHYLLHSGKVDGGRRISKDTFLDNYQGQYGTVLWDGGKQEYARISAVEGPEFCQKIASFVHQVAIAKAVPPKSAAVAESAPVEAA